MNAEKCVCCGAVIPEGRQVCPSCENDNKITNPAKAVQAFRRDKRRPCPPGKGCTVRKEKKDG